MRKNSTVQHKETGRIGIAREHLGCDMWMVEVDNDKILWHRSNFKVLYGGKEGAK